MNGPDLTGLIQPRSEILFVGSTDKTRRGIVSGYGLDPATLEVVCYLVDTQWDQARPVLIGSVCCPFPDEPVT